MLRIHSSAVWAQSKPPVFLSVCGGGLSTHENVRSEDSDIHRRLAHHSRIERESVAGHLPCAHAHHISRVQSECEQEQFYTQSECHFPGFGVELSLHASASLSRACSLSNELSVAVQRGGESTISHMPQAAGSYGFIYPGCTAGTPENESVHEMGFVTTFQPDARSLPLCNSDARLLGSFAPLEECRLLRTGNPSGDGYDAESCDDRCVLKRLGRHPGGQNGERSVAEQTTFSAHKLFRAYGRMESSESFSASPAGTSCACTLRQYHGSGLYQPSGRRALVETSRSSLQAFGVEQTGFPVVTRDSCSGPSKQRRGSSIEGKPNLRRLAPSPADSGYVMDEIRTGNRRSIRLARKLPLSYVLLAKGRGRAPRGRCTGPPVAQSAAVCFSSPVPDNSYTGQGERSGPVSHSDSTQVAQSTMAGGDNPSVICRAMAPPPPHGSIVPSERGDLSPAPGQGGSLGLARERTNLSALGLSPHVIATIHNGRAISTLSFYGSKWQVFEGWCDGPGLTSYQCSVPDILCFLQDLLEKGISFSTIKVYLAAISACHVGFEGSTVGQHPLIRRFMKGARHSLSVVRRTVPEWVLEALSQYPFEPLGSISLKLPSRQLCSWPWHQPNVSVSFMLFRFIPRALNSLLVKIWFPLSLIRPSCRSASLRSLRRCWSCPLFTLHLFPPQRMRG